MSLWLVVSISCLGLSQVVAEKNIINLSCFPSVAITTRPVAGSNNLDINLRSVSSKLVVCLYKLSQFSFSATQTLYNQMGPGKRLSQNKYKTRLKFKLRWFFWKLHEWHKCFQINTGSHLILEANHEY